MSPKDIVRLEKPDFSHIHGHCPSPGLLYKVDGKEYLLRWGEDFIVSAHCDPDNKIASFASSGLPLVHIEFVEKHSSLFTLIKSNEE